MLAQPTSGYRRLKRLEELARAVEAHPKSDPILPPLIDIAASFQPQEAGVSAHLVRVATYVKLIATGLALPGAERELLAAASVLHDVGMLGVSKPLNLPPEHSVREHTLLGAALLSGRRLSLLDTAAEIAQFHHECFDGSGYPFGLQGEAIPLCARVVAVADVFDALTSRRAGRPALSVDVAVEMLELGSGTLFDPEVVTALLEHLPRLNEIANSQKAFNSELISRHSTTSTRPFFPCPFCSQMHPQDLWSCSETGRILRDVDKLSGTLLNQKFFLRKVVGTGGTSTVYEARNLMTERSVAIKLLATEPHDTIARLRFAEEARIFARVNHPGLVEVLDICHTPEGIPFLVMELLEGQDLEHILQHHPRLSEHHAAAITLELARTLLAVHEAGIVHRDIKPSNIFFTQNPRTLKLLDFGIALAFRPDGTRRKLTSDNTFLGTPQYMSPEQSLHRARVDHRSDIFSVGALLYEILTGRTLCSGLNTMAMIMRIASGRWTPARKLRPQLSESMNHILKRALHPEIERRYPNISALILDLENALSHAVAD